MPYFNPLDSSQSESNPRPLQGTLSNDLFRPYLPLHNTSPASTYFPPLLHNGAVSAMDEIPLNLRNDVVDGSGVKASGEEYLGKMMENSGQQARDSSSSSTELTVDARTAMDSSASASSSVSDLKKASPESFGSQFWKSPSSPKNSLVMSAQSEIPGTSNRDEEIYVNSIEPNKAGTFVCHACPYQDRCRERFLEHLNNHYDFHCKLCDYSSRTEGRLRRHIEGFHSKEPPKNFSGKTKKLTSRKKVHRCKYCQFLAATKEDLWGHHRIHIKPERRLECDLCPFVTEYRHHFEYHKRNHTGERPFKCDKCNYVCVNKSMLNSHEKSHTNIYQYRCGTCSYATKYCHSLKQHLQKRNHKEPVVLNTDGSVPEQAQRLRIRLRAGAQSPQSRRRKNSPPPPQHPTVAQQVPPLLPFPMFPVSQFPPGAELLVEIFRTLQNPQQPQMPTLPFPQLTPPQLAIPQATSSTIQDAILDLSKPKTASSNPVKTEECRGKSEEEEVDSLACKLSDIAFENAGKSNAHPDGHNSGEKCACTKCGRRFEDVESFCKHLKDHSHSDASSPGFTPPKASP